MTRRSLARAAVVLAVLGSLALAVTTVRAAADWTASNAPLDLAPTSGGAIAAQLDEQAGRSVDLQRQVDDLTAKSSELEAALQAAQDRIAADADAASGLRKRLQAAQTRLTALEASIARARAAAARRAAAPPAPASVTNGGSHGDDDGEESDG